MSENETILKVKNLETCFDVEMGRLTVLDKVSFEIKKGETLGIVGESGCGKSVTSLSIMRLLPKPAGKIAGGEVLFDGEDISKIPAPDMRRIRGNKISMIFQEPMTALNPVQTVGKQLAECYYLHHKEMSEEEIVKNSVEVLDAVGIPDPARRLSEYPHQLSGGIRQRVMIAMALACNPDLLIADEPTTALDVTIQAQILKLMKEMQKKFGMAIMFITHDLGVIAELCDRVVVMYAGQVVETAEVVELFKNPKHPYTKGLLASIPRLDHPSKEELGVIEGMVPDLLNLPPGCRFENRCPYAEEKCKTYQHKLDKVGNDHFAACWKHSSL
jgi:oligopeptide/dipeptide ABC transporter ATP-binding protein